MTVARSVKARVTTGIVLALVLGAGVVLGVALDRFLEARATPSGDADGRDGRRQGPDGRRWGFDSRGRESRGPSEGRDSTRRRPTMIVDQVGLAANQKEQVDSIVGYYRTQMRVLHEEFDEAYMTRYRELNRLAREDVRAVLTDEQRTAYDSLMAEWAQRRQERQDSAAKAGGGREKP
ncbi:MAG: hypothetical protein HKO65_12030 [Gemmatimonadetes bacterium]|nr:hypothetical protein [Gemmatimonadota bacterium]